MWVGDYNVVPFTIKGRIWLGGWLYVMRWRWDAQVVVAEREGMKCLREKKERGWRRVREEMCVWREEEEGDRISDPEQWADRRHELRVWSNIEHSGASPSSGARTYTHTRTQRENKDIPKFNCMKSVTLAPHTQTPSQIHSCDVLPGTMETVSLSQDTTLTYSCTAAGMRHLNTATLPRIERWSATRTV